jgi:hypothetical protein
MGMFPWDDAFYNIKGKSAQLNLLYNDYIATRDSLNLKGDEFKKKMEDLQTMSISSKALLINVALVEMDDVNYHAVVKDCRVNKMPPVSQPTVAQVFSGIAELSATMDLGAAVYGVARIAGLPDLTGWIGKAAKSGFKAVKGYFSKAAIDEARNAGITEGAEADLTTVENAAAEAGEKIGSDAGIAAVDAAADGASLAATSEVMNGIAAVGKLGLDYGPTIIIALGIDMLIGAIEGKKESDDISDQTARLDKAMNVLKKFVADLDTKSGKADTYTLNSIEEFCTAMEMLSKIVPPHFNYAFPKDLKSVAKWRLAMEQASIQYLYLSNIKNSLFNRMTNYKIDHPGKAITKKVFQSWQSDIELNRDPQISIVEAKEMMDYVLLKSKELGSLKKLA